MGVCDDLISRQAAIDALYKMLHDCFWADDEELDAVITTLNDLPSAQPEGWMEKNKERILQAGMEGREIEFRIGGRLFAIREKAQ